jgi:hypothetical protein
MLKISLTIANQHGMLSTRTSIAAVRIYIQILSLLSKHGPGYTADIDSNLPSQHASKESNAYNLGQEEMFIAGHLPSRGCNPEVL